jgi:hypothetical protein
MASEKIKLMARARKAGIDGYKAMSEDQLKSALDNAERPTTVTAPAKGKAAPAKTTNGTKGKGKSAVTAVKAAVGKATGKGKPASKSTAKSAPAKSTAQKSTPAKGKAAQGAQAKRPTTGGTRRAKAIEGVSRLDNSKIDWTLDSNVGQSGKRRLVLERLRKFEGDKAKVVKSLEAKATEFYPGKSEDDARKGLVWLVGRVAFDYAVKTGQHQQGTREWTKPTNGSGKNWNGTRSKTAGSRTKAAPARGKGKTTPARGKPQTAAQSRTGASSRKAASARSKTTATKGKGKR